MSLTLSSTITPTITSLGIPTGVAGWDLLQNKTPQDFPALVKDPVIQRQIRYFEQNAPKATTAQALLSNPQLQDFVLTAYGLTSENGMTALMEKVLNSNTSDPNSFAAKMVNNQFSQIAAAFNYGGTEIPAVPAAPSAATVSISGLFQQSNFSNFSGTFGGVTVQNVNLAGVSTYQGLATVLQNAFQQADGNSKNITVTVNGLGLQFSDALGRGTASNFTWAANSANTYPNPIAGTPSNLVNGAAAQPAIGGPSVTNSSFIQTVVQKYLQAQMQAVVGNQSNALREALYAKQQLPSVTNWYSVIANEPLANVVETVLGLPKSFQMLNVDTQAQTLASRMNIQNFQNPAKLSSMLTQFVAMSSDQAQTSSASIALQVFNTTPTNGIINLTIPTSGSAADSFSSGSAAAMLMSTADG
jgi:Protein of unknown function (DUF1217)